ncbi:unnamed protein product [Strongylus vulgaris]|uniref:WH2 domain-containing protein n=1 Tax=Strongylus vulgaris TaxID=40348 RepID=A0A3P7KLA4_STRVU|nr:unnamed protein product [Strongylus vulgaris]
MPHIIAPPVHEDAASTSSPPPLPQSLPPPIASSASIAAPPPPPPPPPPNFLKSSPASTITPTSVTKAGISVEALRSVALKKPEMEERKIPAGLVPNGSADFHADLRNALAKRRCKVALENDDEDKSDTDS